MGFLLYPFLIGFALPALLSIVYSHLSAHSRNESQLARCPGGSPEPSSPRPRHRRHANGKPGAFLADQRLCNVHHSCESLVRSESVVISSDHFFDDTLDGRHARAQREYRKTLKASGVGIRTPTQAIRILGLVVESGMLYILVGVSSACLVHGRKHGSSRVIFLVRSRLWFHLSFTCPSGRLVISSFP